METGNSASSQLFSPFRALGFVANNTPFFLNRLGTSNFLTVSIGRTWQIYNVDKLRLRMVGPAQRRPLSAVAAFRDVTFSACGSEILVHRRMELVATYKGHVGRVYILVPFGKLLMSVADDQILKIWNTALGQHNLHCEIPLPQDDRVTAVVHPHTYLNKVLVAFRSGRMQLWNIRTRKLIHTFKSFSSDIRCVQQSPAVDVVGVGLGDGRLVLYHLKAGRAISTFSQADQGAVVSMAFRTDGALPHVATSSAKGHVNVWHLSEKRLCSTMRGAHNGGVVQMAFLAGEPLLVTQGMDNALKVWIFDQADGTGRLLRSRAGHSAPPVRVRFYGDGLNVLSAGEDRAMRIFSIVRDAQSGELSQGNLERKARNANIPIEELRLPQVVDFDAAPTKEREWANLVSAHTQDTAVRTWSTERRALAKHQLTPEQDNLSSPATAVCISSCGHFSIVGTAMGRVHKFNLQSGLSRDVFKGEHSRAVTGVAVDLLNRHLLSCSLDGTVVWWDFHTQQLLHTEDVGAPVTQLVLHKDSELLAVATDSMQVLVFDARSRVLARRCGGATGRVADMAFSPDGRWLVVASMDACVRVYDLVTGRLIDWFKFVRPVTSLSFSPQGDFLVTTHAGSVGLFLWCNRSYFSNTYLDGTPSQPLAVELPELANNSSSTSVTRKRKPDVGLEGGDFERDDEDGADTRVVFTTTDDVSESEEDDEDERFQSAVFSAVDDGSLASLSGLPKARWNTLANLDLIKERNKPKEPPKKPINAPFFLPTVGDVDGFSLDMSGADGDQSRLLQQGVQGVLQTSRLVQLLQEGYTHPQKDYTRVSDFLKALSPSAVDAEIRTLAMDPVREEEEMRLFLDFFACALSARRDVELLQAYANAFFKIHSDVLLRHASLAASIQTAREAQSTVWRPLEEAFHATLCLTKHFSHLQI